jgi:hypothetical protein
MMVHSATAPSDRNKYCHVQCYNKPVIDKVARFRTPCPRCKQIITPQSPIEKFEGKWAHLRCEYVQLHEPTLSPYEQLLQLTLIAEDDESGKIEDSQSSGISTSSSYSRVSSFDSIYSSSVKSSTKRSAGDDFTSPEKK